MHTQSNCSHREGGKTHAPKKEVRGSASTHRQCDSDALANTPKSLESIVRRLVGTREREILIAKTRVSSKFLIKLVKVQFAALPREHSGLATSLASVPIAVMQVQFPSLVKNTILNELWKGFDSKNEVRCGVGVFKRLPQCGHVPA